MYLSSDTTQNAYFVNCVKHHVYTVILPLYGIREVFLMVDCAGCFSGNEHRTAMSCWEDWTDNKIKEVMMKVAVPGCGKSPLDGFFGVMTVHANNCVKAGASYHDPDTFLDMMIKDPMNNCRWHIIKPDRKYDASNQHPNDLVYAHNDKSKVSLRKMRLQTLNQDQSITFFQHSTHSSGLTISRSAITNFWNSSDTKKQKTTRNQSKTGNDQNSTTQEMIPNVCDPQEGDRIIITNNDAGRDSAIHSSLLDDNDSINMLTRQELPHRPVYEILRTTVEDLSEEGNIPLKKRTTEPIESRQRMKIEGIVKRNNNRLELEHRNDNDDMKSKGVFCCENVDGDGNRCLLRYMTKTKLDRHVMKGNHQYRRVNSLTASILEVTADKPRTVEIGTAWYKSYGSVQETIFSQSSYQKTTRLCGTFLRSDIPKNNNIFAMTRFQRSKGLPEQIELST